MAWVPFATAVIPSVINALTGKPRSSNATLEYLERNRQLERELADLRASINKKREDEAEESRKNTARLNALISDYQQKLSDHEKSSAVRQAAWDKEKADREKEYAERMDRIESERKEWVRNMEEEKKLQAEQLEKYMKEQDDRRERETKEHADRLKTASEEARRRMQEEFDCRNREMAAEQAQMKEEFDCKQRERDAETERLRQDQERMKQDMEDERARNKEDQQRLEQEQAAERERLKREFKQTLKEEKRKQDEQHRAAMEELERKAKEREDLLQAQNELYARGISPKIHPTDEEWANARKKLYPDPLKEKFHCAIAGVSGSGKSSLINALRGITNKASSAASVGIVETTTDITAYPHPGTIPPQNQWVWYDVPGSGTLTVPAPKYFNAQGLFVFDLIIVVVDNRFTSQDVAILQQCVFFKIPSFIVRSKSNQHINNIMREELDYMSDDDDSDGDIRKSFLDIAKQALVKNTRASFEKNLKEGDLDHKQRVYIVSADCVRLAANAIDRDRESNGSGVNGTAPRVRGGKRFEYLIDEFDLLQDLHKGIAERRYGK